MAQHSQIGIDSTLKMTCNYVKCRILLYICLTYNIALLYLLYKGRICILNHHIKNITHQMIYEYKTNKGGRVFYPANVELPKDLILWNGFDREKQVWVLEGVPTSQMTQKLYKRINTIKQHDTNNRKKSDTRNN